MIRVTHIALCAFVLSFLSVSMIHAAESGRTLEHSAVIDAPVRDVWDAFTANEGIQSWMVPVGEVDLRIGGDMRTSYNPDSTLDDESTIVNRIISYEPERMLSIQNVQAPAGFANAHVFQQTWSVIHFESIDHDRTRVRIVGLGYGDGPAWDDIYNKFDAGNAFVLKQLQRRFAHQDEAPTDATAEETLDALSRLVGGEWIHENTNADGQTFLVRNIIRIAPDQRSLIMRGWLGTEIGMAEHADTQVWREPGTDSVRFQNLSDSGDIARGAITLIGDDTLNWDWRAITPNGEQQIYRIRMKFTGKDTYAMTIDHLGEDDAWQQIVVADFTRVEKAPARFHKMIAGAAAHE